MLPFNYHHLFYFYTIATEGSISAAAKRLRVSQPAVSVQLKTFEDYLEVRLFQRGGKKLVLTAKGRIVMKYARTIFNTGNELCSHLSNGHKADGAAAIRNSKKSIHAKSR